MVCVARTACNSDIPHLYPAHGPTEPSSSVCLRGSVLTHLLLPPFVGRSCGPSLVGREDKRSLSLAMEEMPTCPAPQGLDLPSNLRLSPLHLPGILPLTTSLEPQPRLNASHDDHRIASTCPSEHLKVRASQSFALFSDPQREVIILPLYLSRSLRVPSTHWGARAGWEDGG